MKQLFVWLNEVIEHTFCEYFEQNFNLNPVKQLPDVSEDFQKMLMEQGVPEHLNREEWGILALALAPHFSPQTLDWFLFENTVTGQSYSEFGGIKNNRNFFPTAQTAVFVLAADRLDKRLELMRYFHATHWFYTSTVLQLIHNQTYQPLLNGLLKVSDALLNRLCGFESNDSTFPSERKSEHMELLDQQKAKQSPCMDCSTAQCCKIFHLDDFVIASLVDFDRVAYYLNFEYIEAVFSPDGRCTIYYSKPCRFFNEINTTCTIHNQPEQSSICVHYSPYRCFYKKAAEDKKQILHGNIWLNGERLQRMQEMTLFDENREIAQTPSFHELVTVMNLIPYDRNDWEMEMEENISINEKAVFEPCSTCQSLCCTHLLFPSNKPQTRGNLDYYKYALGFEGIEYVITDNAWAVLVHTQCKYLSKENRCTIYSKDERPLFCRYFDPYKCHVKQVLHAPNKIQANYEVLNRITEHIYFDDLGNLLEITPVQKIKQKYNL